MNDYVTDEEQVERIKKWWSDNGSSVIAGLVIGVGGLLGWRGWVDYKTNIAAEASSHFVTMVSALESGNNDSAIESADIILNDYSSTAYANLARLSLARAFVQAKEYDKAASQLQSLVNSKPDISMEMLARKRLAAVLFQQGKLDPALQVLKVDFPKQFAAAFEELQGDILTAQGNASSAREAYQRAQLAQPASPNPQFLQQKMEDLGLTSLNG
ncbi:MAG: tetratricopeptide repeat protein [Gammaproteobacteria bacterium]|nr:tetratricopeptide repeat protein [Gammaproteobacteria bacterium]MBL7000465.1 tetratricopeptide repeat protein [Gammaproteobacteria bacterium]